MPKQGSISIVFQVRTQSERCPEKVIRDFYKGKSLTEIAVEKFANRNNVFIAGRDERFRKMAQQYHVGYIERSMRSIMGETADDCDEYIKDIPGDYVCVINVCVAFLMAQTVDDAITQFMNSPAGTLFPTRETRDIIFDASGMPINKDALILNSKFREPHFTIANGFIIYTRKAYLDTQMIFDKYTPGDPMLFPISERECLDIDTEEQFALVKLIYANSQH